MADNTHIEWTDATWNPTRGCTRVSAGCQHCYAETVAKRFSKPGQPYAGLIHPKTGGWNGKVRLVPEALQIPWHWVKGRRIFVDSMSDLFHEDVPFEFIAAVFWVMSVTTRHTYQVLTKRPERMLAFFRWLEEVDHSPFGPAGAISDIAHNKPAIKALGWEPATATRGGYDNCGPGWPYENVWLGVSVENQEAADERIPLLLDCPAAVRWISAEPLLGPIDLENIVYGAWKKLDDPYWPRISYDVLRGHMKGPDDVGPAHLDWVVCGGESGTGARPMHPDWARSLRDQCAAAGVPFLFKQNGAWVSVSEVAGAGPHHYFPDGATVRRLGKKAAGRTLDGVMHDGYPT